jgi:DNA-directed RNA polymerase beta subunit
MNLGQIYETVLGWAGKNLGMKFATPIFDGATLDQINEYTEKAGIPNLVKPIFMMVEPVKNSTSLQQ